MTPHPPVRPYGISTMPPNAVIIVSPTVARVLLHGLELVEAEQRAGGTPMPRDMVAGIRVPLEGLARFRPEPVATRGDVDGLAAAGSAPLEWLTVRDGAGQLGVSEEYMRRLARTRLAGDGLAVRVEGAWKLAPEGVAMIERERTGRAA